MSAWPSSSPSCALTSGQRKIHISRDEEGRIVGAGGEDQEQDDIQAAAASTLLHLGLPSSC
ncbi:MAG: hypothetical protein ACRDP3_17915 [Streptomyces sp.]|uniref:hypothetical protein n=1 Tax=Streptomyces sp. TaxID=1931 RepID=UPI003D6A5402